MVHASNTSTQEGREREDQKRGERKRGGEINRTKKEDKAGMERKGKFLFLPLKGGAPPVCHMSLSRAPLSQIKETNAIVHQKLKSSQPRSKVT